MHRIIELPDGGYATVFVDEIANTAIVLAHDGSHVERLNNEVDVDMHLAMVAAASPKRVEVLMETHKVLEPTVPRKPKSPVVEHLLVGFIEDTPRDGKPFDLLTFRNYCQERHRTASVDATWPEYWQAVLTSCVLGAMRAAAAAY